MAESFSWFVARRYLTARRQQAFVSVISGVSILGVGVGVMALIIALALMTGVQMETRARIVGAMAHLYVYRVDGADFNGSEAERQLLTIPGVAGVAPAIQGFGLLSSPTESVATLKGIDPSREPEVTDIARATIAGSVDALVNRPEGKKDGIALGEGLAQALGVHVGDVVWIGTMTETQTPFGAKPRERPLEVVAILRFGFYEIDNGWGFLSLDTAEVLLGRSGPDMMQIKLADLDRTDDIHRALQERLGRDYRIKDWRELNQPLYSALWLEKVAISLTIGLIVAVAALNIVASLVLLVMEKSRDIAILRTIGAPARTVRRIFVLQGLAIGLVGTSVGTVLGLLVCYLCEHYQLIKLPSDVYQITYLPFRVQALDVVTVVLAVLGVCLVATIYPSRQAGRIDPAEALRNQ